MDGGAGAELPPLSVHTAVKARLSLELLRLLLSVCWLLLYSIIVILIVAAPVITVVVVGLSLSPFLSAVSTRNSLEGDGLVCGILTRLRHGYGMLCEVGGSVGQFTVALYRARDKWSGRSGKLEGEVGSRVGNVAMVVCCSNGDVGGDY
jgi:hypothetical protein